MSPLVSVIMPCYNSAETLPLALSSLVAQTHDDWECIIVDDGSTDNTASVIELVNDSRIKYFRFQDNVGRGAARQKGLDLAAGNYIAMLDSDDWLFPEKLERQLAMMEERCDIALLSTGMAIVDRNNEIVGTRTPGLRTSQFAVFPALRAPKRPPVAHAPSMIRAAVAKKYKYDKRLHFVEDADFLLKILLDHPFGILPEVTYAYAEVESATLDKRLDSLRHARYMYAKYRSDFPIQVYSNELVLLLKQLLHRFGSTVRLDDRLVKRRSHEPSGDVVREFHLARDTVYRRAGVLFDGTLNQILGNRPPSNRAEDYP